MTPKPTFFHPALACAIRFLCCAALPAIAPAFAAAPAAAPEPKTHTLFMGADFDVEQHDDFYRVVNVSGSDFVVKAKGEAVRIPTENQKLNLKVQQSLKLTTEFATIGDLKSDRAYTPANDPGRKWANRGSMPNIDQAQGQMVQAQGLQNYVQAQANGNPSGFARAAFAAEVPALTAAANSATGNFNSASVEAQGDLYNRGQLTAEMQAELAKGLFDAVEVTFNVSSPTPLKEPYVVLVAQYHDPSEPGNTAHNWIYARALEPIDAKPRSVHFLQGGFPAGFKLEKLQVHLYNRGRELATNVADKRVPLTYDEAFTYVVIQYLATHKGASLPATPALAKITDETRSRLGDQFTRTYFVKVSKDGIPQAAYLDEPCAQKVADPYLNAVINDVRFNPALEKGQPVAGVARLTLDSVPTR